MIYHQKSSEREVIITKTSDGKIKKEVYCFSPYMFGKSLKLRLTAFSHFLNWIKANPIPGLVTIHDSSTNLSENYYSYIMEELKELNRSEENLVDDYYKYHNGDLPKKEEREYNSLIKRHYKLYCFLEENSGLYDDIHGGNIGISKDGNYKFMDLEGSSWDFDAKQDAIWVKFKNKIIFQG